MFKKILIANRGEIACRIARTCQRLGIAAATVHSDADRGALHVREVGESVHIGPAPASESYLNIEAVIAAAKAVGADAVHPGYGFLSENAAFAEAVTAAGLTFIGPAPAVLRQFGDKAAAKAAAVAAGVAVVPGSKDASDDPGTIMAELGAMTLPALLKAAGGGGGKGMRAVWSASEITKAWEGARQEAKASFGNDAMYMEKLIEEPRHIEIQIIGDCNGNAVHLSERDCSIQRRHQKLTEETPSPFMTDELRSAMGKSAILAAEYIKYEGAGTIEFLVDKHRNFYFMEMNTRIQVEHPITEEVTDYDLIREQIKMASGVALSGRSHEPKQWAIECRINAEDPHNNFRPSPGKITAFHAPGGHGVRVDTHVYAGYTIPPNYDSMIAKLIVTGRNRSQAIERMKRALDEFVIEGVKTTIPFHQQLMVHSDYVEGNYTTKFMEDFEIK